MVGEGWRQPEPFKFQKITKSIEPGFGGGQGKLVDKNFKIPGKMGKKNGRKLKKKSE